MKPEYIELYEKLLTAHREVIHRVVEMDHEAKVVGDLTQLADLAYVLRESHKLANDLEVELGKLQKFVAKIYTVLWSAMPDSPNVLTTEWCSCTPDPKDHAHIPKRSENPELYDDLMRAMGMPEDQIKTGLFRVSWESFGGLLTKMRAEGKPLPEGLGKVYVEHRLSLRSKRKLASAVAGAREDQNNGEDDDDGDYPF